MIKIAVTKGRVEKSVYSLFDISGFDISSLKNKNRKLAVKIDDNLEVIFLKSIDVIKFVDRGIVDIGIVGKDALEENKLDNYNEILDLGVGKCYFALAGYQNYKEKKLTSKKKIATKYPNIAKRYFQKKNEDIEIIKMEGSVELAPIVGMADGIVDIVETGDTLNENGLNVIEKISDVSTRLIVNKDSLINKPKEVDRLISKLKSNVN